jgi:hypothetical protein
MSDIKTDRSGDQRSSALDGCLHHFTDGCDHAARIRSPDVDWGAGEKQGVEIFLSDLGRLQRDIVGMARYRVLLRAGLVEQPKVAFQNRRSEGGRDELRLGDTTIRITGQAGLQANPRRWVPTGACAR